LTNELTKWDRMTQAIGRIMRTAEGGS